MKNNRGAIEILGLLIFTTLQILVLKGAEYYDLNRPKNMLKIQTGDIHTARMNFASKDEVEKLERESGKKLSEMDFLDISEK